MPALLGRPVAVLRDPALVLAELLLASEARGRSAVFATEPPSRRRGVAARRTPLGVLISRDIHNRE